MNTPWRTMREAAEYLRFMSRDGEPLGDNARRFFVQHGVKLKKRGHSLLVHIDDMDGVLREATTSK